MIYIVSPSSACERTVGYILQQAVSEALVLLSSEWCCLAAASYPPICLALHFSSSGLSRPLATATRWPQAGLIPTTDPAGVTVVVYRRTAGTTTASGC
ncbi:hypothetical protein PBY51_014121 [Eleginops maclovinus]|uniref:Uncharacterized protein n=1 Tax=Eleginops maclovinus TaxID=56733 RepID=A0AAN7WW19_ELEMC|nr:hypothetical protein PBY51_014121 [Eleginops maclovinus]